MKKNLIVATLTAAAALCSASSFAQDGTVNFTGEIIDSACTVDIGSNNTMVVDLGKVAKTAFTGVGSTASATKFTLVLKDCPATVSSAKVKFDGTGYANDNTVLALTPGATTATGVAIQLSDAANVLPLATSSASYPLSSTGVNNLDFFARYIAKGTVVAGLANSTANFTVNYN